MGINFSIVKHLATLNTEVDKDGKRWNTELNIISWNDQAPQFDVRTWDENHDTCHYGIKMDRHEIDRLVSGMNNYYKWCQE